MNTDRMSRRRFLQLSGLTAASAAFLAACPAPANAPSDGDGGGSAETSTVSMGLTWGADFQPRQAEFNENFMAAHPEIELDVTYNTWGDHNNIVPTWAAADTLPDIVYVHGSRAFPWSFEGIIVSIQDYVSSDEEFNVDGIWSEALRLYEFRGNLHAIPYDHGPLILGYNKDIFDAAGHEYPSAEWTTDDLRAAAEALTITEGDETVQYGWEGELPSGEGGGYINTFGGWGAAPLAEDEASVNWDTEEARAALEFWTAFHTDGLSPSQAEVANAADQGPWIAGRVAMAVVPSWETPGLAQFANFQWDVAAWPEGPVQRQCGSFGSGFGVTKNSQNPDGDWVFLREYLNKEGMEFMWGSSGRGSPARKDAYQSWMDSEDAPENAVAYLEALDTYALTGRPYQTLGAAEYIDICTRQTNLLRNGETDVDSAIAAIMEEAPGVLAEAAERAQGE